MNYKKTPETQKAKLELDSKIASQIIMGIQTYTEIGKMFNRSHVYVIEVGKRFNVLRKSIGKGSTAWKFKQAQKVV